LKNKILNKKIKFIFSDTLKTEILAKLDDTLTRDFFSKKYWALVRLILSFLKNKNIN
jgi:hypothetical protein